MTLPYNIEFSRIKNKTLLTERGFNFDMLLALLDEGCIAYLRKHPNIKKYPHQFILIVETDAMVYAAPCVIEGKRCFLKTVFPSRKLNKLRSKEK